MYSMYQSDFDTKHDFVGGEEKTLNQRQIGAALLLQKYVSLLCAHAGEILPVASSLATNGPRYCFCFIIFLFNRAVPAFADRDGTKCHFSTSSLVFNSPIRPGELDSDYGRQRDFDIQTR